MRVPLFIRLICVTLVATVALLAVALFTVRAKVNVARSQARTMTTTELEQARAKLAAAQHDLARDMERATQIATRSAAASASTAAGEAASSASSDGDAVAELQFTPPAAPDVKPPPLVVPELTINSGPTIPSSPNESLFKPDVYPTPRAAMAALVPQVIEAINELPAGTLDAAPRVVIRDRDALPTLQKTGRDRIAATAEPCLRQLPDALRENFPQLDLRSNEDATTCPDPHLVVQVSTKDVRTARVSWSRFPCVNGTLLITIGLESGQRAANAPSIAASNRALTKLSAKFTDRTWADVPAEFPNGTWMVGRTPGPVESVKRAEEVAFEQAANALTPKVAERAGIVAGAAGLRVSSRIKEALKGGDGCVADRFAQSFQRPYGTVYAEQLLLDVSPQNVDALARRISAIQRAETAVRTVQVEETRTTFKQVLGFMLVVLVLYWFLNAATKGYFTWQLRAGAVLLVLAGVVMIVATAGYFMVPHPVIVAR